MFIGTPCREVWSAVYIVYWDTLYRGLVCCVYCLLGHLVERSGLLCILFIGTPCREVWSAVYIVYWDTL